VLTEYKLSLVDVGFDFDGRVAGMARMRLTTATRKPRAFGDAAVQRLIILSPHASSTRQLQQTTKSNAGNKKCMFLADVDCKNSMLHEKQYNKNAMRF
jgi:hypothetical protein